MAHQFNIFLRFFINALLLVGLLNTYSCQEQAMLEELEIATKKEDVSGTTTLLKNSNQFDVLEPRMQWVSYITARILCSDRDALTEVMDLLRSQNTDVIDLDQLLTGFGNAPRFRELFMEYATFQIVNIDGLEQIFPEPSHNQPIPPSSRQNNIRSIHDFIEFLTVDHCLELFFVNAFPDDGGSQYYSTAHPLTIADHNYGYAIFNLDNGSMGPGIVGSLSGSGLHVEEATVDPSLAISGSKIIVCRPQRELGSSECDYADLERIDFTVFLDE